MYSSMEWVEVCSCQILYDLIMTDALVCSLVPVFVLFIFINSREWGLRMDGGRSCVMSLLC